MQGPAIGLGFMLSVCLSIDLIRQSHMRYKAEQLVIINKYIKHRGVDPRNLTFRDKFRILTYTGINLFVRDFD